MKLILFRIAPYKEKDAIIEAISENESLTFKINRLLDPKNKFSSFNNPLTIIEGTLKKNKNNDYLYLEDGRLIFSPLQLNLNFEISLLINLIIESSLNLLQEEERYQVYPIILNIIDAIKNNKDTYIIMIKFLTLIFQLTGYGFELNHCVRCGNKNSIVTFSFSDGGFICKDCFTNGDESSLSNKEMMLLRNICLSKSFDSIGLKYTKIELVHILENIYHFVEDAYGIDLNSLSNIIK